MGNIILIVEDCDDDAVLLQRLLTKVGVTNPVHLTRNTEDAISFLEGAPPYNDRTLYPFPGILLLDLKLPGTHGFRLLEWLENWADKKEMLVVAVSGVGDLTLIRQAYQLGANSFLTKPCRVSDIENLIHGFPRHWTLSAPLSTIT